MFIEDLRTDPILKPLGCARFVGFLPMNLLNSFSCTGARIVVIASSLFHARDAQIMSYALCGHSWHDESIAEALKLPPAILDEPPSRSNGVACKFLTPGFYKECVPRIIHRPS
jgi:hypothetical protein